ncbi:hypothetical protein [Tenacibaculum caenipelagi]|uniref:Uncharacterized protein n=1 Tax=Tenacibaculum caenipelagi TaxID=1325435 RepID=A0A4R6TJ04_9FLAO|nr:hypothetical protein [Tenacibaculum caenipelagi]TDQ28732.1 hypothetical protein DFQ07_1110 [Tenacibaculum caenipelagi]
MENKYLKEMTMNLNPGGDNDLTEGGSDTGGTGGSDGGNQGGD